MEANQIGLDWSDNNRTQWGLTKSNHEPGSGQQSILNRNKYNLTMNQQLNLVMGKWVAKSISFPLFLPSSPIAFHFSCLRRLLTTMTTDQMATLVSTFLSMFCKGNEALAISLAWWSLKRQRLAATKRSDTPKLRHKTNNSKLQSLTVTKLRPSSW